MIIPAKPVLVLLLITIWGLITCLVVYIALVKRGSTSLHRACSAGKLDKLRQLLDIDPGRINEPDRFGISPVQYAAGWGRLPAVQLLIDRGCDINQSQKGWTALTLACAAGHYDVIDLLLEKNADVNKPGDIQDVLPIHTAVNHGRIELVRKLLAKGADVNGKGQGGISALHLAAWRGEVALIELLLEAGADITAKDEAGLTPEHFAKQERKLHAQEMLEKVREQRAEKIAPASDDGPKTDTPKADESKQ